MPRIISIPSRGIEVEFPDSLPEAEIDAYLKEKYPRSGQDVAFEVQQDMQNSIEPFGPMSKDDYLLYRKHLAEKKTSFGDALGIATDTFNNIINDVGTGIGAAAYKTYEGEYGKVAKSAGKGIYAGTLGLADIAYKIVNPSSAIPSKEEFLNQTHDKPVDTIADETIPFLRPQVQNTEQDYNALIEREKARDSAITNRLFEMEAILQSAPIEEVARGSQYLDPTMLAGGASALLKAGAKTIFKTGAKTAARTAGQAVATTAPGAIGQAALGAVERGAGAVKTVTALPGKAIEAVGNVAEGIIPGTGMATKGAAITAGAFTGAGVPLATSAATSKVAETVQAAARAARSEASRASPLERAAMRADISPAARKLAAGLAQIQPLISTLGRVAGQALKEGAQNAAVGAGLGYLAERNLEGAAAGAGGGFAFGGMSGAFRSAFGAGKEALGYSTSRTARQAVGDINTFISERPQMEQAAWSDTFNRLVEKVGPEKAAAQADAMKVAEAAGGRVRVATPDEIKQWQNPGWMNVDGTEVVLNPTRILGDTAAHEATHVLFASTINRAFKPEIESAIFGTVDPTNGEIIRPGVFNDVDLAKISDQIADSYGKNTTASNEFRGYANRLRNTTDAAALSEARTRIADELTATYAGKMFGRLRAGRFNPDRLPLVYRRVLNSIEDGIVDKFRTVLMEQGQDLGFNSAAGAFVDSKGRKIRIPELDAIIKKAMQPRSLVAAQAKVKGKPDLIPVNPADRAVWARSYGGARGILNDDLTPKSMAQMEQEKTARWQDMTSRMAALPDSERLGIEFSRDAKGNTVMTAKGQLSDAAINQILTSGTFDQSSVAVLREVLSSMKNFDKATFDTRYYSVYARGKRSGKMAAGVEKVSMNEILPYSVEANSQQGVIIRAVDMTTVRDRLMTAMNKPQFKGLYSNAGEALKDFRTYLTNLTNINAVPSEVILGGGVKGTQKRNLFYDALGFRLRNGETLVNAPNSIINKAQDTLKSYRVERFAKLVDSGERLAFEEGTTYERAMKNFQPDAFTKEQLPNGEAMTNPDGYRVLKQAGGKLWRSYDEQGKLIGTSKTSEEAMKQAQADYAKKVMKEEKKPSIIKAPPVMREMPDGYKLTQPGLIRFQPVRAYHGTPHKVDKFSTKKINTGEGAQAYGWGLYFAENWNIADEYRGKLQKKFRIGFNGKTITELYPNNEEAVKLQRRLEFVAENTQYGSQGDSVRKAFLGTTYGDLLSKEPPTPSVLFARQVEKDYGNRISTETGGNLYTVDLLPDESEFLDWDKPLSQQSEKVKAALSAFDPSLNGSDIYADVTRKNRAVRFERDVEIQDIAFAEKQASKFIYSRGIPGIKYLDASSRSAGEGTHNYVIFDDKLVKIIEENGKPVGEQTTKRFQPVSPEQDAAYLQAVKAGDKGMIQKMVDAVAKAAGYSVNAWHSTFAPQFTEFDMSKAGTSTGGWLPIRGMFFSTNRNHSSHLPQDVSGLREMQVSLKLEKPLVVKDAEALNKALGDDYDQRPDEGLARLKELGFDSVVLAGGDEIIVTSPSQIKSADPVTYDDAGNVIPLSQRFNPQSSDIRFQPDPASTSVLNGQNGSRIVISPSGKFRVYNATGKLLGIRDTEEAAKKLASKQ